MSEPAKRRATYEDVLAAPPTKVAEVISGVLHLNPRPAVSHAKASSRLAGKLLGAFDDDGEGGPGGWTILFEPELHLGPEPDIVVPDLAGWRSERMPRTSMKGAFIPLAPDWLCEVLSPSTESLDRGAKMDLYAREGVGHAWLINPLAKVLEVFRLEHEKWMRVGTWTGDVQVRAEPFDAIELKLGRLWL